MYRLIIFSYSYIDYYFCSELGCLESLEFFLNLLDIINIMLLKIGNIGKIYNIVIKMNIK